ncbi:MAG: hypothetical protein RI967_1464, partial [Planctomycetota bacterium]
DEAESRASVLGAPVREDATPTAETPRSATEIARESRAETVALSGLDDEWIECLDHADAVGAASDACGSVEPPSAYDRALDVRSLFEGLSPDRWIETRDPRS